MALATSRRRTRQALAPSLKLRIRWEYRVEQLHDPYDEHDESVWVAPTHKAQLQQSTQCVLVHDGPGRLIFPAVRGADLVGHGHGCWEREHLRAKLRARAPIRAPSSAWRSAPAAEEIPAACPYGCGHDGVGRALRLHCTKARDGSDENTLKKAKLGAYARPRMHFCFSRGMIRYMIANTSRAMHS